MAGHTWSSLHGDMPMREMNDEVEPAAVEGDMPTRPMTVAQAPVPKRRAPAAREGVDAEVAMYRQNQGRGAGQ